MAGLGIAIAWVGYATLYYGVTQVQGGNWGFLDLILPGRWAGAAATPRDNGSTPGVSASAAAANASAATAAASPPASKSTVSPSGTVSKPNPQGVNSLPGSAFL